jgi:YHS domain-containing protein
MLKQLVKILCLFIFLVAFASAQDKPEIQTMQESKAWNTVCPVCGNQVSSDVPTIKFSGKDYGFDGSSCAVIFNDDPGTYSGNLNEEGTHFTGKQENKTEDKVE